MKRFAIRSTLLPLAILALATAAHATRVKDLVDVEGVRGNPLVGYGLVIGLDGTGDGAANKAAEDALINMLENLGLTLQPGQVKSGNIAAVMVTAELPPFARQGSKIDLLVSSIGNAKSLQGGTLLMTPLRGGDGHVYAVGQGPLSIGGFSVAQGGDQVQKNHPTVGKIVGGALVERELPYDLNRLSDLSLSLHRADFSTVTRMAEAINQALGVACAKAVDGSTVTIRVPEKYRGSMIELLAVVEAVDVSPDRFAKVVVNERTGTIIMGDDVRISRVAISHGSLNIQINEKSEVSQPLPFSKGETKVNKNVDIDVVEEGGQMHLVGGGVSIGELVRALNAIGATPRDLIAILQAIDEAGALQARLEIL
jgi:flagellar P-ring protein precursor FlgI